MTLRTTVQLEVVVTYSYHGAIKGARDTIGGVRNAGPPLEPDEPAHVEIESVKIVGGPEIELTDEIRAEVAQEAFEHATDVPDRD